MFVAFIYLNFQFDLRFRKKINSIPKIELREPVYRSEM